MNIYEALLAVTVITALSCGFAFVVWWLARH